MKEKFYPQAFFETQEGSTTIFFGTVRQTNSRNPRCPQPSPPSLQPPMHESFGYQVFSNTDVFPDEFFKHCEAKEFRRKNMIPPAFLLQIFFPYQKFSETRGSSLREISFVSQKKMTKL